MFNSWVQFGAFDLAHHWYGVDVLLLFECVLLAAILCLLTAVMGFRAKRRKIVILSLVGAFTFATAAWAANTALSALSAGASVGSTDLFYDVQTPGVGGVKVTAAQIKTFIGGAQSVSGSCGVNASPTSGAVIVGGNVTARNNVATSDTLVTGDCGTVVTENNAAPVAVGIAQAGSGGFASGWFVTLKNKGAGLVTITPTAGNIDGASSLTLKQNQSVDFYADVTNNYTTLPGRPTNVAAADLVGIGANVATAINTALSAAGGLTSTVATGTAALGTSAISSNTCGTATTVSAPGVATTDVINPGFNGDPTATVGYTPAAMLTIVPYPTSGNVNFKQCNLTGSSITASPLTLNWSVRR